MCCTFQQLKVLTQAVRSYLCRKICKSTLSVSLHHLYVFVALVCVALSPPSTHRGRESQSQLSVFNQALDWDRLPWDQQPGRYANQDTRFPSPFVHSGWIYRPIRQGGGDVPQYTCCVAAVYLLEQKKNSKKFWRTNLCWFCFPSRTLQVLFCLPNFSLGSLSHAQSPADAKHKPSTQTHHCWHHESPPTAVWWKIQRTSSRKKGERERERKGTRGNEDRHGNERWWTRWAGTERSGEERGDNDERGVRETMKVMGCDGKTVAKDNE